MLSKAFLGTCSSTIRRWKISTCTTIHWVVSMMSPIAQKLIGILLSRHRDVPPTAPWTLSMTPAIASVGTALSAPTQTEWVPQTARYVLLGITVRAVAMASKRVLLASILLKQGQAHVWHVALARIPLDPGQTLQIHAFSASLARIPLNLGQTQWMRVLPVFQANTPPPSEQVTWPPARIVSREVSFPRPTDFRCPPRVRLYCMRLGHFFDGNRSKFKDHVRHTSPAIFAANEHVCGRHRRVHPHVKGRLH